MVAGGDSLVARPRGCRPRSWICRRIPGRRTASVVPRGRRGEDDFARDAGAVGAPAASGAPSSGTAASKGLGRRVVAGGALVVLAVVLASALRLQGAEHSALAFHPIRQYASLAVAKARYEAMSGAPESSTSAAVQENARAAPRLEPRLLEWVVALGYLALGREDRGLGASLSSVIWVGGGLLLLCLGRRLGSSLAAGVAAAFHLFLPYGIIASRSFQPVPPWSR